MDSQVAQYYTMQLQKGRHIERTRSFGAIQDVRWGNCMPSSLAPLEDKSVSQSALFILGGGKNYAIRLSPRPFYCSSFRTQYFCHHPNPRPLKIGRQNRNSQNTFNFSYIFCNGVFM